MFLVIRGLSYGLCRHSLCACHIGDEVPQVSELLFETQRILNEFTNKGVPQIDCR